VRIDCASIVFLTGLALGLPALAQSGECREANVVLPAKGSVVEDQSPTIAWERVPGASDYRIEIESRIPNGRVLARIDSQVTGLNFTPTRPLASERAAVKVSVTAGCKEGAGKGAAELGPSFFVDVRGLCAAPAGLRVSTGRALVIEWSAANAAAKGELSLFSLRDGAILVKEEVIGQRATLTPPEVPFTIAVRNRCGDIYSKPVYRLMAPAIE